MNKALVLSTIDFHYQGHGWSIAQDLSSLGVDVCFMCLEKSMPETEYYFFDKCSGNGFHNLIIPLDAGEWCNIRAEVPKPRRKILIPTVN